MQPPQKNVAVEEDSEFGLEAFQDLNANQKNWLDARMGNILRAFIFERLLQISVPVSDTPSDDRENTLVGPGDNYPQGESYSSLQSLVWPQRHHHPRGYRKLGGRNAFA